MHETVNGGNLPSVLALAYLGDARHSLFVRRMLVERGLTKPKELNAASLEYVTAAKQAEAFQLIREELLPDEMAVFRRASNSTHLNKPRGASGADYRTATGFEAVIGMLVWLGDEERAEALLRRSLGLDG